ncbi:PadR family transcriptional regulator [Paenibacillaceae bacterium WGS1546]|uniref:PadR family transcriptional regulator n=1 Tax=Cohnella sp. WGS1546 TaxID=3366810 RepID=UPI00372D361E
MEFVLLGFLMIRALTQYEMKKTLQRKVSPFYSASLGSIQSALKKLEDGAYIECRETVERGRRKKVYAIAEPGKQRFMSWMTGPIAPNRLEQEMTTRLFFLGLMDPPERLAIVRMIADRLEAELREYDAASAEAAGMAVPDRLRPIADYQLKTLELGIRLHRSSLDWFKGLREQLEADTNDGQNVNL